MVKSMCTKFHAKISISRNYCYAPLQSVEAPKQSIINRLTRTIFVAPMVSGLGRFHGKIPLESLELEKLSLFIFPLTVNKYLLVVVSKLPCNECDNS